MKITFKQLQEAFIEKGASIEKEGRAYHFNIKKGDVEKHIYMPKVKMADVADYLEKIGFESMVDKFEHMTATEKKEKTITKKASQASEKKKVKVKKKDVTKLEDDMTELTLKIMGLEKSEKHSKKHLKLRSQLHEIYNQLVEMGQRKAIQN